MLKKGFGQRYKSKLLKDCELDGKENHIKNAGNIFQG